MKKTILFAAAAAFFMFALQSCGSNGTKENKTPKTDSAAVKTTKVDTAKTSATSATAKNTLYECPMKCGNKTFEKPGKCPECGMTLVEIKS